MQAGERYITNAESYPWTEARDSIDHLTELFEKHANGAQFPHLAQFALHEVNDSDHQGCRGMATHTDQPADDEQYKP